MTFKLEHFRIEGLYGTRNIDIPIKDSQLIIIGENGTGKSTVANFIYYFLTRQWWRMWQYDFKSVSITIDSVDYYITKTDITIPSEELLRATRPGSQQLPSRYLRELRNYIVHYGESASFSSELFADFLRENDISYAVVRKWIERENDFFAVRVKELSDRLKKVFENIQILYLPTYRRIEKELESILQKGRLEDLRGSKNFTNENLTAQEATQNEVDFIELSEFGMKDVEQSLQQTMMNLKDRLTSRLNKLTGQYLREVVLGTYKTRIDHDALSKIDAETVEAILSRVGEEFFSSQEKLDILAQIRNKVHLTDDVVGHFLLRLNDLYTMQRDDEQNIEEFVRVCNTYLRGKRVIFDNSKYRISIMQTRELDNISPLTGQEIKLRDLSSGEKQIISLFSHIHLSKKSGYFVVIDEPELSLSVPWQRTLLPDIAKGQNCHGLVAVTHSPFIFDNEFRSYVYSLEDFVERV